MADEGIVSESGMTGLVEGAVVLNELFRSYIAGGFTEQQAVQLLAALITNGPSVCAQCGGNPRAI